MLPMFVVYMQSDRRCVNFQPCACMHVRTRVRVRQCVHAVPGSRGSEVAEVRVPAWLQRCQGLRGLRSTTQSSSTCSNPLLPSCLSPGLATSLAVLGAVEAVVEVVAAPQYAHTHTCAHGRTHVCMQASLIDLTAADDASDGAESGELAQQDVEFKVATPGMCRA